MTDWLTDNRSQLDLDSDYFEYRVSLLFRNIRKCLLDHTALHTRDSDHSNLSNAPCHCIANTRQNIVHDVQNALRLVADLLFSSFGVEKAEL
jgi:hypothetical protein